MKLTLMIEQPPDGEPHVDALTTEVRGWVTVLDEYGVPLLRLWVEPNAYQPTVGLGIYGPLGDYVATMDLTCVRPGTTWEVSFPGVQ